MALLSRNRQFTFPPKWISVKANKFSSYGHNAKSVLKLMPTWTLACYQIFLLYQINERDKYPHQNNICSYHQCVMKRRLEIKNTRFEGHLVGMTNIISSKSWTKAKLIHCIRIYSSFCCKGCGGGQKISHIKLYTIYCLISP